MTERVNDRVGSSAEGRENKNSDLLPGQSLRRIGDRVYKSTDLGVRGLRGAFEAGNIQSRPGHNKRSKHKGR